MYMCVYTQVLTGACVVRVGLGMCLEHGMSVGVNSAQGGPSYFHWEITGCFGCMCLPCFPIIYNAYRGVHVCVRSLHPGEPAVQVQLWSEEVSDLPRYTFSVVDLHKTRAKSGPFALFLVPQGRLVTQCSLSPSHSLSLPFSLSPSPSLHLPLSPSPSLSLPPLSPSPLSLPPLSLSPPPLSLLPLSLSLPSLSPPPLSPSPFSSSWHQRD